MSDLSGPAADTGMSVDEADVRAAVTELRERLSVAKRGDAGVPMLLVDHAIEIVLARVDELERLHTWPGLMSLLDEHYPADVFTGESGDAGARIVALVRAVDELRLNLAGVEGERDAADDSLADIRKALGVADEVGWGNFVRERIQALRARDEAAQAVVRAWREVQPKPFVIPAEMTDLAIALDALARAHEKAGRG